MGRPKTGSTQPGGANAPRFYSNRVGHFDKETPGVIGSSKAELIQKVGEKNPNSLSPNTGPVLPRQFANQNTPAPAEKSADKPVKKPSSKPAEKPMDEFEARKKEVEQERIERDMKAYAIRKAQKETAAKLAARKK